MSHPVRYRLLISACLAMCLLGDIPVACANGGAAVSAEQLLSAGPEPAPVSLAELDPQSDEQRLREVLKWSYQSNPTLRAARAALRATHESLPQARSGYLPTVSVGGNVTSTTLEGSNFGAAGSTSKDISAGFSQPVFRGGQTIAGTAQAKAEIGAGYARLVETEQQVLLQVATAYMDVLRDFALLDLSESNKDVIDKQLEASRHRFEVGDTTRTDVAQSEARLAQAEAGQIRARGDLQASKAVYRQLVGREPVALAEPALVIDLPATLQEAISHAESKSPVVRAAEYDHKAAKKEVGKQFGDLLPGVELFGEWLRSYDPQPGLIDESTSKTVGVSASLDLYQGGAARSRVRQAKYTANERFLQIMEAKRAARQQVVDAWEALQTARAEIRSREAQVKAASIAQEGVHQESQLGLRTVLDSLDADQEYLDAQVALVSAKRDEVVATFSLAAALGMLTPENLGFPELAFDEQAHLERTNHKILGMDVEFDGND